MSKFFKISFQFFADGTGGGEGEGGAESSGVDAVAAGQQRLQELGVPKDKLRPGKAYGFKPQTQPSVVATTETKEEEEAGQTATAKRMTWDEIKADPEYNKEMQKMMSARVKGAKENEKAAENLKKMTGLVEVLSRKYGLDANKLDYDALNKAVEEDAEFYEEKGIELGVPAETAMRLDKMERENARRDREEKDSFQQRMVDEHFARLEQEGEALKAKFPNFDLRTELQNPSFARLTAPGQGIMSVEDAYYAVHRREIAAATEKAIADQTAQKISNAIQSNSRRPQEAGTNSQAPSVTSFDWSKSTREQREALKREIRAAAARGEHIRPGTFRG